MNFFTSQYDLKNAYAELDDSIPVSFAIVPFQSCIESPAVPENKWGEDELMPFGQNVGLIRYVREQMDADRFSPMLHGYSHKSYKGVPEFVAGESLSNKVKEGREHLETTLDTSISTFVPPNNSISKHGLAAVKGEGLNICYYPSTPHRNVSTESAAIAMEDLYFKYNHVEKGPLEFIRTLFNVFGEEGYGEEYLPVMPRVYEVNGGREVACSSLTDECLSDDKVLTHIKTQMQVANEYDGVFCLAVHYHSFKNNEFKQKFHNLVSYAKKKLDPQFVTVDQLFREGE